MSVMTQTHNPTPKLSFHARQRCEEMNVVTGRVKRVLRNPDLTYTSGRARIAWRAEDPSIAVVFVEEYGQPVALTVVWRTYEQYSRDAMSLPLSRKGDK